MRFFPKEWEARVNNAGMMIGGLVAGAGYAVIPLQAGLNTVLFEPLTGLGHDALRTLAIGVFSTSIATTAAINSIVIKKHGYCADLHTNIPYVGLGLVRGVIAGVVVNVVWGTIVNPNDWVAWTSLVTDALWNVGDSNLAAVNIISKSLLFFGLTNLGNTSILTGMSGAIVERLKSLHQK